MRRRDTERESIMSMQDVTGSRIGVVPASARLDAWLARRASADGPFHPSELVALDRTETFPDRQCRELDDFGLPRHYVPAELDGALEEYADILWIWRTLARRDLTVAIAHGKTFLGAVSCWVAGTREQRETIGGLVSRGAVVAWGLTERGHGSDLLAGELVAAPEEDGYRLSGAKWLINNATRAQFLTILARTAAEGGPRGFSLFFVDKERLSKGAYECLPKERTHGIRGADISGIDFRDARVPGASVIGATGSGLEIVLSSLQVTRTLCVGLSLGALDHALELASSFARGRSLYDRTLIDLPHARQTLANACSARFVAEAVAMVAARALHCFTEEAALTSAVCKAFVPALVEDSIADLGELIGARAFLCDVFEHGEFQKLARDHRIVPIFDGSTAVNRHQIVNHFSMLARQAPGDRGRETVAAAADLRAPLPAFDPGRLRVRARSSSLIAELPGLLSRERARTADGTLPGGVRVLARSIELAAMTVREEIVAHSAPERHPDASAFAVAERFELCWAAAACLALHERNRCSDREESRLAWRDSLWLRAALTWILRRLDPDAPIDQDASEELGSLLQRGRLEAELTLFPELRGGWCEGC